MPNLSSSPRDPTEGAGPAHARRRSPSRNLRLATCLVALVTLLAACGTSGGIPAAPRDVAATAIPGGVNVTWLDQSSDEQGFVVLRQDAGSSGPPDTEVGRVGADVQSFADFSTAADGAYVYAVQSFNASGVSDAVLQSPADAVTPEPGVEVIVTFDGDGSVTITGGLVSKTCTNECQVAFGAGTEVTFSAESAEGAVFAGWAGGCSGAGTCVVEIDEPLEVQARFRRHVLQLSLAGDSPVSLTMFPADDFGNSQCELSRGDECALAYGFEGPLAVSINATMLDPEGDFNGFEGPCSTSSGLYCLVNVSGATPVAVKSVRPPVAAPDAYQTLEDQVLEVPSPGVLGNDTDSDDDALTAVVVDAPSNGELALADDGSFSYTPSTDLYGSDSFTYQARDLYGNLSEPVTVSLTILAVNDPPVFELSTSTVAQGPANGQVRVLPNFATGIGPGGGADEEGQELTFTITRLSGSLGTMTIEPDINEATGTLMYTPATGSVGSATYEVRLSDKGGTAAGGNDTSAPQQFTIEVAGYTLTTAVIGGGQVSASPISTDGSYGWGTTVTLGHSAADNYGFVEWQGDCTGAGACQVAMTENRTVTARFDPYLRVRFADVTESIIAESTPESISCNSSFPPFLSFCDETFEASSSVTLAINGGSGNNYLFSNVECAGPQLARSCTFTITEPVTVRISPPQ